MSVSKDGTEVRLDTDDLAEIVKDHYRSWNIDLDSENYVWDGMHLKLKVKGVIDA